MAGEKKIKPDMTLGELAQKFPKAVPVLAEYGFHCIGCPASAMETLEQGAKVHGLSDEQLGEMLEKLNKAVEEGD